MYYFDQAATSLKKPKEVAHAVYQAISSETIGNSSHGGHDASIHATRIVYQTRESLRSLFHASNYHVVLTKNATEALNIALKSIFQKGDHILTTVMEHNSVLRPLFELEHKGVKLDFVQCTKKSGILLYEQFEKLLSEQTKAVVVTHASNVTGNVNDLKWLSQFCKKNNLRLIVDASQSAGIVDINLEDLAVDILCFTGHKGLYGPQGTGGMCIKKGIEMHPLLTGGSGVNTFSRTQPGHLPESLEAGTLNVHGLAGLCAGVQYVMDKKVERLSEKVRGLIKYFYEEINEIKAIQIYGDIKQSNSGIVSLNISNYDASEISSILLEQYNIFTRAGAHCAPLMHRHFGTEDQGMVRFSFSSFNTYAEVDYAIKAIKELVRELV